MDGSASQRKSHLVRPVCRRNTSFRSRRIPAKAPRTKEKTSKDAQQLASRGKVRRSKARHGGSFLFPKSRSSRDVVSVVDAGLTKRYIDHQLQHPQYHA